MIHEAESASTPGRGMERPQITVAIDGSGDHRTITEAIAAARNGATIKIHAGVYEEALVFEKPVTLSGDQNGLVLIHNPNFTAASIRRTEVIMKNLAWGTCKEQVVLSAEASKIRMTDCVLAPTDDLLQSRDSNPACVAHAKHPMDEKLADTSKDLNAVSLKADCSLLLMRTSFKRLAVHCITSRIEADSSTFELSRLDLSDKSTLDISNCTFDCGELDPAVSLIGGSSGNITTSTFHGIAARGISVEYSQLSIEHCDLRGTFKPPMPIDESHWILSSDCAPGPFESLQEAVLSKLNKQTDNYDSLLRRFVSVINACDGLTILPQCLENPVIKKMMWEHERKFSTLRFDANTLKAITIEDVLRPLTPEERDDFYRFCKMQDVEESSLPAAVVCGSVTSLQVSRTKMSGFRSGVAGEASGNIVIEEGTFAENQNAMQCRRGVYRTEKDALGIAIRRCTFNRNDTAINVFGTGGDFSSDRSHVIVEGCEIRDCGCGISITFVPGRVRTCIFERNKSSVRASPSFLLKCVENCKGFGDSTAFKIAKTIRGLLPF